MYTSPVGSDGPFLGIFLPVRIAKKQYQTERGKKYFVFCISNQIDKSQK